MRARLTGMKLFYSANTLKKKKKAELNSLVE